MREVTDITSDTNTNLRYEYLSQVTVTRFRSREPKLTAVGIRCADHATPSIH
jgi:hypothetical protein